jgi:hypothetical protein
MAFMKIYYFPSLWNESLSVADASSLQAKDGLDPTGRNCWPDPWKQFEVMTTGNTRSEPPSFSQRHAVCLWDESFANAERQISCSATTAKNIQTSLKASATLLSTIQLHILQTLGNLKYLSSSEVVGDNRTEYTKQNYRLHLVDKISRRKFLIDSGSAI